jgi:FkbM family methyltransferase
LWPGVPFSLACPVGTDAKVCARLSASQEKIENNCAEPETQTQEVINSFLLGCPGCLYVDIGCNIGLFAGQAAALGAHVLCYEPTPSYTDAVRRTIQVSKFHGKVDVINAAVVADDASDGTRLSFDSTYRPCGIRNSEEGAWQVPAVSMHRVLFGRRVKLLKIDIDSVEGSLFHTAVKMIEGNETDIETILIEIGDMNTPMTWEGGVVPPTAGNPRGGDVNDFFQMQRRLGYDIYRINTHAGREIFDWKGDNVNKMHMAQQETFLQPMFGVRSMRKLDKLSPDTPIESFPHLFRWGISLLLTRVQLAQIAVHHPIDIHFASSGGQIDLNSGNPAAKPLDRSNFMA